VENDYFSRDLGIDSFLVGQNSSRGPQVCMLGCGGGGVEPTQGLPIQAETSGASISPSVQGRGMWGGR
jgi:hypothetical protein